MKLTISTLLVLFTLNSGFAQEFKTPLDYLEFMSKESDLISQSTWKYTLAVAHSKSARKIDNTRKNLVKSIQNSKKKIENLKDGYKGDVEYRDQMIAYLDISENHINQEYDKIIDMQEVAEQSYDFMEAYILARELVNEKINAEMDQLNANQKIFANKYGVQISESKSALSEKMKISNEVFDNQTELYLIFFKANITDYNLMKATQEKDLSAIQQNATALQQFAEEGLTKLKMFKTYKNDPLLVNATKKAMEFYQKEAVELAPKIISFLMLNEKMQESSTAMNNKSPKNRTKEEVDAFNKLVNEVNKEIGTYNKLNAKFNADKSLAVAYWNNSSDSFVSKHVPKD
ncbi:hypothetical protein [Flavobacterium sp. SM2513]|uniref:hypothetical protein n=1 Tax=Flavobacterium sp. SM2513 TaxID=3424766 RepID=UPI003D7FFA03